MLHGSGGYGQQLVRVVRRKGCHPMSRENPAEGFFVGHPTQQREGEGKVEILYPRCCEAKSPLREGQDSDASWVSTFLA